MNGNIEADRRIPDKRSGLEKVSLLVKASDELQQSAMRRKSDFFKKAWTRACLASLSLMFAVTDCQEYPGSYLQATCTKSESIDALQFNFNEIGRLIDSGKLSLIYKASDGRFKAVFPYENPLWYQLGMQPPYKDKATITLQDVNFGVMEIARGPVTPDQVDRGEIQVLRQIKIAPYSCK